jgi:hypothetical protein
VSFRHRIVGIELEYKSGPPGNSGSSPGAALFGSVRLDARAGEYRPDKRKLMLFQHTPHEVCLDRGIIVRQGGDTCRSVHIVP